MKKLLFLLLAAATLTGMSCSNLLGGGDDDDDPNPGKIKVVATGLQSLTGFDASSDIQIQLYDENDDQINYTITDLNADSFSVFRGNPATVFEPGTYGIDVLVDINSNTLLDVGVDYWLIDYYVLKVDGDATATITSSDFELY